MTIYISGSITGHDDYKERFAGAEANLRSMGCEVLNPTRHPEGLTKAQYMRYVFADIDAADGVFLLPGWATSGGAQLEHDYAKYIGKPVFHHTGELQKVIDNA